MKPLKHFFCLLLVLSAMHTRAQNFTVDRPGIADTPYLVGQRQYQFEFGVDYLTRPDHNRFHFPNFFFRTGLGKNVELRLSSKTMRLDSLSDLAPPYQWDYGLAAPTLGLKVRLLEERGLLPEIALMTDLILPIFGSKKYRAPYTGHDVFLLLQNNLTDKFALNYNVGSIWEGTNGEAIWAYSVCAAYQLGRLGIFAEHYAYLPEMNLPEWGFDGGLVFLLTPKMQADLSAGVSLVGENRLFFVSSGLSFRIDAAKKTPSASVKRRQRF